MKIATADWLRSAKADLETIDAILGKPTLTAMVAFHAQQCVEKCLKALLEEFDFDPGRTGRSHNLLTLKALVEQKCSIDMDEDTLSLLNKLYIGARYPGEFGLLPEGAPTIEEAQEFARFAAEVKGKVKVILNLGPLG
jgi:HEPN domain-containing protein